MDISRLHASYLRLTKAIDRRGFEVHLNPINITDSPPLFLDNTDILPDADEYRLAGEYIGSVATQEGISL